MTWGKVDDGFWDHPKIVGLSDRSFRSLMGLWAWSWRNHRTKGHVPAAVTRQYLGTPRVLAELESAGLIHKNGTGWVIHDWAIYRKVDATGAERKRRWRDAHRDGGNA